MRASIPREYPRWPTATAEDAAAVAAVAAVVGVAAGRVRMGAERAMPPPTPLIVAPPPDDDCEADDDAMGGGGGWWNGFGCLDSLLLGVLVLVMVKILVLVLCHGARRGGGSDDSTWQGESKIFHVAPVGVTPSQRYSHLQDTQ